MPEAIWTQEEGIEIWTTMTAADFFSNASGFFFTTTFGFTNTPALTPFLVPHYNRSSMYIPPVMAAARATPMVDRVSSGGKLKFFKRLIDARTVQLWIGMSNRLVWVKENGLVWFTKQEPFSQSCKPYVKDEREKK